MHEGITKGELQAEALVTVPFSLGKGRLEMPREQPPG